MGKINYVNKDGNEIDINVQNMSANTKYNFRKLKIPFVTNPHKMLPIGLDVGFSSTKIFSIFGFHKFPSVVKKIPKNKLKDIKYPDNNYIIIKLNERNYYLVGDSVVNRTSDEITNEDTLFTQNRLNSKENLILNRTGIALALMQDDFSFIENPSIRLCLGLPEKYVETHQQEYIDLLKGHHNFEIKIGNNDWKEIDFSIKEENIYVISQPFGTLLSLASDIKGKIINESLLQSGRTLLYDGGFGTIDDFLIENGAIVNSNTDDSLAMKSVFEEIKEEINEQTNENIQVHKLNYYMKQKDERFIWYKGNQKFNIDPVVQKSVCNFAQDNIEILESRYRGFNNVDCIVMTGGTGKAFYPYFKMYIPKEIILAEVENSEDPNEDFDCVYANSVGFFKFVVINYRDEIDYIEDIIDIKDTVEEVAVDKEETEV